MPVILPLMMYLSPWEAVPSPAHVTLKLVCVATPISRETSLTGHGPEVPPHHHLQAHVLTILLILLKVSTALLYPRHTKFVEGYIVFVFPSIRPSVCASVHPCVRPYKC